MAKRTMLAVLEDSPCVCYTIIVNPPLLAQSAVAVAKGCGGAMASEEACA